MLYIHKFDTIRSETSIASMIAATRDLAFKALAEEGPSDIIRGAVRHGEDAGYSVFLEFADGEELSVNVAYDPYAYNVDQRDEIKDWLRDNREIDPDSDLDDVIDAMSEDERRKIERAVDALNVEAGFRDGGVIEYAVDRAVDQRDEILERARDGLAHYLGEVIDEQDDDLPKLEDVIECGNDLAGPRQSDWNALVPAEQREVAARALGIATEYRRRAAEVA